MATLPIITQHTHAHMVYSIPYWATDHNGRRFLKEPALVPKITKKIFRLILSHVLTFPTLLSHLCMIYEPQLRKAIRSVFTDPPAFGGGGRKYGWGHAATCHCVKTHCTTHSRRPRRRRSRLPGCRHQARLKRELSPLHKARIQPPQLAPANKHMSFLVPDHSCACRQSATTTTPPPLGSAIPSPGTARPAPECPH